ncbi:AlpA family phage regulatory protein [Desulfovibrio sp. OttesenSCG-928-I05]|nr:AlpA family phage regulatory protein [Desulfovibrio sp. OttesenSCG-928-I05]
MSQAHTVQPKSKGAMRIKGVAAFFGIATSTAWKWHAEGKIPPGIKLSPRCTVWRIEDLERFLNQAAANGVE